jgi:FKBP-type peptidyl-prolyl cis-trans isomerase
MTFRITPFALAALLAVGVGCSEGGSTGSADEANLESMDEFGQIAYAFGFESAQGLKADSASFEFFEFGTFEDGFRDGLAGDSSRIAYLFGYEVGNRLGRDTTTNLDADIFLQGFREGLESDSLPISDEELQRISTVVQDSLRMRQLRDLAQTDTAAQARLDMMRDNAGAATSFLSEVEAGGEVTKTESGLLYTIAEPGTGEQPTIDDVVEVRYTGRLADGTEFDSSGDETATFSLRQVAPGFREGVLLLQEGGSGTFYLPPDLGYGQEGTPGGPIPPNAALVFEVELVDVMSTQEAGQPALPGQ